MVTPPIDGAPATHGNGCTVGFAMTPEQADAWHKAGTENGGAAIEDAPGVREVFSRFEIEAVKNTFHLGSKAGAGKPVGEVLITGGAGASKGVRRAIKPGRNGR